MRFEQQQLRRRGYPVYVDWQQTPYRGVCRPKTLFFEVDLAPTSVLRRRHSSEIKV